MVESSPDPTLARIDQVLNDNRRTETLFIVLAVLLGSALEGNLRDVPYIPMLKDPEPRQGFLHPAKFSELHDAMPENLQPILFYLYLTGCRTTAAKKVDWTQVSFNGERVEILLRAEQVKNKRPLLLPLPDKLADALRKTPLKKRTGPVFDATNLTKAFRKACVAVGEGTWRDPKNHDAGYDGLMLHDLRRSGVRNLRRAKVSEDVAMKVSVQQVQHRGL